MLAALLCFCRTQKTADDPTVNAKRLKQLLLLDHSLYVEAALLRMQTDGLLVIARMMPGEE
jgi:hypothetical protein